jgi:LPS sulfotransferase NodH
MALFCAHYLASAPFSAEAIGSDAQTHGLTGYYGFLDYAAANWWKHVKRIKVPLDPATADAVSKLSNFLDPAMRNGAGPNDMATFWCQIQKLRDDGREWEKVFPIEDRIKPIRLGIEALFSNPEPLITERSVELEGVRDLYGCVRHKWYVKSVLFILPPRPSLGVK